MPWYPVRPRRTIPDRLMRDIFTARPCPQRRKRRAVSRKHPGWQARSVLEAADATVCRQSACFHTPRKNSARAFDPPWISNGHKGQGPQSLPLGFICGERKPRPVSIAFRFFLPPDFCVFPAIVPGFSGFRRKTAVKKKEKNRSRLIQAAMGKIPCDLTVKNPLHPHGPLLHL